MSDALFLTLLAIVSDTLQGVAAEMLKDFLQRLRPGKAQGEIDGGRLGRAIQRAEQQLNALHQGELRHLDEAEWSAAVHAVRDSLAGPQRLNLALAFEAGLDPQRLAQLIEAEAGPVLAAAALSDDGQAAYRRTLAIACDQLLIYFRGLPQFEEMLQTHTFWRVGDVARQLDQLLRQRERQVAEDDQRFAVRYAGQIADALGGFELFGVTRGNRPRRHTFDKYVTLAVARRTRGEFDDDEDGLTGVGIDVANALVDHPRVIVRAGAGRARPRCCNGWRRRWRNGRCGRTTGSSRSSYRCGSSPPTSCRRPTRCR